MRKLFETDVSESENNALISAFFQLYFGTKESDYCVTNGIFVFQKKCIRKKTKKL